MNFAVANATHTPALLRFTLFDADGKEEGRYEQILPIGTQRAWSLSDLFNIQKIRGSVRLWSDVPIAISDERITTSLRGEPVENEIGYVDSGSLKGSHIAEFPAILDGAGIATGIAVINPTEVEIKGEFQFSSADGRAADVVLR